MYTCIESTIHWNDKKDTLHKEGIPQKDKIVCGTELLIRSPLFVVVLEPIMFSEPFWCWAWGLWTWS